MDMNQLFYHHQIALMAVDQAHHDGTRLANYDLPRYYAKRINQYRIQHGLAPNFVGYSGADAQPQS
ncbi:MAG TPA: hypothetical protein VL918_10575 [Sphingobium sp.]|nr:hypothetical protein [Sphingobium sp.]